MRSDLVGAVAHHGVVALVFTGVEVLRRTAVVRAEAAAVVPVGAGEEPEVAAFAQQGVPYAADLRAVHAGAAIGRAACRVGQYAVDGLAQWFVFTAIRRGAVAGLRLHAESDFRRCVVQIAQVFDVEAIVAVRVEGAGAFKVGWNVVAAVGMVLRHPFHGLDSLQVAPVSGTGTAGGHQFLRGGVPAEVVFVQATWDRAIPVVAGHGPNGCVAAAGVGIIAVEAIFPLGQRVGVAHCGITAGVGGNHRSAWERSPVERRRQLTRDDGHRRVLVSRNDRLDADEQRQVLERGEVLGQ